MDDRYRGKAFDRDNRNQRGRQDEQFTPSSDDRFGDAGWRTQENERWQSGPDFDRGFGRNDPFDQDWRSASDSSNTRFPGNHDRSNGPRSGPQDRSQSGSYGRLGSYGAGGSSQSHGTTGYGADRYDSSDFGSRNYRSDNRSSGGFDHIPPRQYDRDDRGFFDRASDEVMSWFGDDDAARRRQFDHREDHRGKGPSGYTRSKERLLEDANERLMHDPSLDASKVTVTCEDNEITLSGTVDSRSAKRRAEEIVDNISGVTHVQNNLRVESRDRYYSDPASLSDS